MRRILCFGDSNTWGAIPHSDERFDEMTRWTQLLQQNLGYNYQIIEEGLCGRTVATTIPELAMQADGLEYFYNGAHYFYPCLLSHDPVDLVIIMLGTNDLKDRFNNTPESIAGDLEQKFVKEITTHSGELNVIPEILIITPIAMDEDNEYVKGKFSNGNSRLRALNDHYRKIAERNRLHFFSAFDSKYLGNDGLHFSATGHEVFAKEMAEVIQHSVLTN